MPTDARALGVRSLRYQVQVGGLADRARGIPGAEPECAVSAPMNDASQFAHATNERDAFVVLNRGSRQVDGINLASLRISMRANAGPQSAVCVPAVEVVVIVKETVAVAHQVFVPVPNTHPGEGSAIGCEVKIVLAGPFLAHGVEA